MNKHLLAIGMLAAAVTFTSCGEKKGGEKQAEAKTDTKTEDAAPAARTFKSLKTDVKASALIRDYDNYARVTFKSSTQDVDPVVQYSAADTTMEYWKFEMKIDPKTKFTYKRTDFTIHAADDKKDRQVYSVSKRKVQDDNFKDTISVASPNEAVVTIWIEVKKSANFSSPADFVMVHLNNTGTGDEKTLQLNIGTGEAKLVQ